MPPGVPNVATIPYYDGRYSQRMTWTFVGGTGSTSQSDALINFHYNDVVGVPIFASTGWGAIGVNQFYDIPPNTVANGRSFYAEVWTRDQAGVQSVGAGQAASACTWRPNPPVLVTGGVIDYTQTVRLAWTFQPAVGGQTQGQYRVQIYDVSQAGNPLVGDTGWIGSSSQFYDQPTGLFQFGHTYHWYVATAEGRYLVQGDYGAPQALVPDRPPNAPVLGAVANFDAIAGTTFTWTFSDPDAGDTQSAYQLQVFDMTTGGNLVGDTGVTHTGAQSFTQAGIPAGGWPVNGHSFQWTVVTWDAAGTVGPWAARGSFACVQLASAPILTTFPGYDATTFKWFQWQFTDPNNALAQLDWEGEIWDVTPGTNSRLYFEPFGNHPSVATQVQWGIGANALTNGRTYQWRIRTKNNSAQQNIGPFAAFAVFTCVAAPTVVITMPPSDGYTHNASTLTVQWRFTSTRPQASFQLRVFDQNGVQLSDTGTVNSAAGSYLVSVPPLVGGQQYSLRLHCWDDFGTQSADALRSFIVAYTNPPAAVLTATPNPSGGYVSLGITPQAAVTGQVPVDHYDVYRRRAAPRLLPARVAWDAADPRPPLTQPAGAYQKIATLPVITRTTTYSGDANNHQLWQGSLGALVAAQTPRYEPGRFGATVPILPSTNNTVANGQFETDVSGWGNAATATTISRTTGAPAGFTGTACLQAVTTGVNNIWQTLVSLQGNFYYRIDADVLGPAGAQVTLQFVDPSPAWAVQNATSAPFVAGVWQHLSVCGPCPFTDANWIVRLYASAAGTYYTDEVRCVATTNIVQNATFETANAAIPGTLNGWAGIGTAALSLVSSPVSAGSRAMQVTVTAGFDGARTRVILNQEWTYQVSADIYAAAGLSVLVRVLDNGGATLVSQTLAGNGAWQRAVLPLCVANASGGTAFGGAYLDVLPAAAGTCYVDAVAMNIGQPGIKLEGETAEVCSNPSFETNTNGWAVWAGGTIARANTTAAPAGAGPRGGGRWHLNVHASAVGQGVAFAFSTGQLMHTISADVFAPVGFPVALQLYNATTSDFPINLTINGNGGWQRVTGSGATAGAGTYNLLFVEQSGGPAGGDFSIDNIQISTIENRASTYYDVNFVGNPDIKLFESLTAPFAALFPATPPWTLEGFFWGRGNSPNPRVLFDALPRVALWFTPSASGTVTLVWGDPSGIQRNVVSTTTVTNLGIGWHYFALLYDGINVTVRIDGTQVLQQATSLPQPSPTTMRIGALATD